MAGQTEYERLAFARVARLHSMAEDVLGSKHDASEWLTTPNRGLGGVSPVKFAVTETGGREVEDLLGRIAHGLAA